MTDLKETTMEAADLKKGDRLVVTRATVPGACEDASCTACHPRPELVEVVKVFRKRNRVAVVNVNLPGGFTLLLDKAAECGTRVERA
jgi:hypothetical protein